MSQLNESDQRLLLKIARQGVYSYLAGKAPRPPEITSGSLAEAKGVFVTLRTKDGDHRGSSGNVHPAAPLYRATADCAVSAAVGDPLFTPLTMEEFPRVDFEISILSPMEKAEDVNSIEVGRDGIFISKKGARGLLLPQEATENGWDRNRFLAEACRKAGLKAAEWKEGASIFRFTAQVFGEKKPEAK